MITGPRAVTTPANFTLNLLFTPLEINTYQKPRH
jgi:hypothetical protein